MCTDGKGERPFVLQSGDYAGATYVCMHGLACSNYCVKDCSPGLGFVHVGHENSFVYDIADLYKADITIPLAFGGCSFDFRKKFRHNLERKTRIKW